MTNLTIHSITVQASVATLERLVQGERAAVTTYEQLQFLLYDHSLGELEINRTCHVARVQALLHRITALGGISSACGNAWFTMGLGLMETAPLSGRDSLINALQIGEDLILKRYRRPMTELDPTSCRLVAEDLLPAQERAYGRIAELNRIDQADAQ